MDNDETEPCCSGPSQECNCLQTWVFGKCLGVRNVRAAARRALLHQDVQAKLKKALLRRPGGEAIPFLPGQRKNFWVPGPKHVRHKKDRSGWRGPATMMVREGEERYFVSWRGRCLLLSAANMRPATAEEAGDMVRLEMDAQEAIQELEKMKSFQDATSWRPSFDDISGRPWQAQDVVMVPKSRKGRPYNEAKEMMRGLKSVRKVIRHPLFRKRVMAKRRQKQKQQLKQKAPEGAGASRRSRCSGAGRWK